MTASWVYLHLTADGGLLYVGKTHDRKYRQRGHEKQSSWWPDVVEVDYFGPYTETEALAVEAALLGTHNPSNNILGTERAAASHLARAALRLRTQAAQRAAAQQSAAA